MSTKHCSSICAGRSNNQVQQVARRSTAGEELGHSAEEGEAPAGRADEHDDGGCARTLSSHPLQRSACQEAGESGGTGSDVPLSHRAHQQAPQRFLLALETVQRYVN